MVKHDSILENKTNSKTRYLLPNRSQNIWSTLPSFGQQDFHWRCTITLPNPPSTLDRTFSPLQHSSLTRVKIRCQHMSPNFGVKCPFYFEINLCHDYAAERSLHLLPSRFPCGRRTKISSLPLTFHYLNHTTGICRFIFRLFTHTPQIKFRGKKLYRRTQPIHLPLSRL